MAASKRLNGNGHHARGSRAASPSYDRKLEGILRQAAAVFRTRGYHQASMRDIARVTGVSLAGLYYYFAGKEEILYLIQRHAFETILTAARDGLRELTNPEERLRALIRLHVQFFLDHPNEMKVLTHEEEWLGEDRRREVRAIKRAYYQLCLEQVDALKDAYDLSFNGRLVVLSLFGMMNWIYTWYNPRIDPDAGVCAGSMADLFLRGIFKGSERDLPATNGAGARARAAGSRQPRSSSGGPDHGLRTGIDERFGAHTS